MKINKGIAFGDVIWDKEDLEVDGNIYFTYEEAKKEVDDNIAEFNRQAELSEYDWCVEQIDKTLSRFKFYKGLSDEEINQYREWILGLDNIENTFKIKVIAEDGSQKEYILKITKQTNIVGKIITENTAGKHKSLITVYKTNDTRVEDDEINPREIIIFRP